MERPTVPTPSVGHAIAWPHLLSFTARLLRELRAQIPPVIDAHLRSSGFTDLDAPRIVSTAAGVALAELERDLAAGEGDALALVERCASDVPVVRLSELRNAAQALGLLVAELDGLDDAGRRTVVRCVERIGSLLAPPDFEARRWYCPKHGELRSSWCLDCQRNLSTASGGANER